MSKQAFKYSVRVNGVEFTRGSNRVYTHAIVAQRSYTKALERAKQWTKQDEDYLVRTGFPFYVQQADGSYWTNNGFEKRDDEQTRREVANAQRIVALGLDGYREECKAEKVATVELYKARGYYAVSVISWHGTRKAADSASRTHLNRGYYQLVRVIEVGADVRVEDVA